MPDEDVEDLKQMGSPKSWARTRRPTRSSKPYAASSRNEGRGSDAG